MELDPARMCALLVGLPDVTVLGLDDVRDGPLRVHVETTGPRCLVNTFTENVPAIAAARLMMTDPAGRWVTEQVGWNVRTRCRSGPRVGV